MAYKKDNLLASGGYFFDLKGCEKSVRGGNNASVRIFLYNK